MRGMNKAIIFGNLGAKPEIRNTNNGTLVAKMRIATGEKINEVVVTEWHNIVVFGKTCEYIKELDKGDSFGVEGRITHRSFEGKDGNKKYFTEIIAERCHFINSKKDSYGHTTHDNTNDDEIPF